MLNTDNEEFIITPYLSNIITLANNYINSGFPVHFTGPTGIGKTSIAAYIAKELKRPITIIRGHHDLTVFDLIGKVDGYKKKELIDNYVHSVYKKEIELETSWVNGELVNAVKQGHLLIYDEFTRTKPEVNNIFLYILEEKMLPLYGTNEQEKYIPVHKDFSVIFTSNPVEYSGVYKSQDALLDRMVTISLNYLDQETEIEILQRKYGLTTTEAKIINKLVSNIRNHCTRKNIIGPSLRASMMIAKIAKTLQMEINPKNRQFQRICYDVMWNNLSRCFNNDMQIQELIIRECQNL